MAVKREIKVGIFVLFGLIVAGVITFMVGDERRVFDKHYSLHAAFQDVVGLKAAAPVRMGGVDVGSVSAVRFSPDPNDKHLHVSFSVISAAHQRIRDDSVVTISNKGLLGDKMLEVSQGSEGHALIPDGGEIRSTPPDDLKRYLDKASDLLDLSKQVLENIRVLTGSAADPRVTEDIKASLSAVRKLLEETAHNDGFIHRLAADPKTADRISNLLAEGANAGRSIDRTAADVRVLLERAKTGPGLAHTLIYGKDGDKVLESLAKTSDELAATMKEIRTGRGAAHELIYGASGETVARDLAAIGADLRAVVADLRAGKGTLGALLVDPSLYEDVKSILGNIDRNQVLRALVRYTIKQDEARPSPATAPPVPAQSVLHDPPKAMPPVQPKP